MATNNTNIFLPHDCECRYSSDPYGGEATILMMCPLHRAAPDLLAALEKIATAPEGVYSRDKETYLKNVIEWCQETARATISKAKGGTP